jgi:predicted PurR-regulated permease PerM
MFAGRFNASLNVLLQQQSDSAVKGSVSWLSIHPDVLSRLKAAGPGLDTNGGIPSGEVTGRNSSITIRKGQRKMNGKIIIPENQRRIGLLIFLAVMLLFLVLNAALILPYVLAILMGVMLKVLANTPFYYLRKKGLGPKLSAAIVVAGILLLLIGPLSMFLTIAIREAITLGQWLSHKETFSVDLLIQKIVIIGPMDTLFGGAEALEEQIRGGIQNMGVFLTNTVLSVAGRLPDLILQLLIALITCFFLLLDGHRFILWCVDKIPMDPEVQEKLTQSFKDTSISVVWSSFAAAAAQALLMFIAFVSIGVPGAFFAAGTTFIFAWIPIIGSSPIWITGAIYLYTKGAILGIFIMVAAGLIISVTDNIIRTIILKGRSNMHPLVSLIAILGGIRLFGILGVFVGPILAGVLKSLLQIWPVIGRRFGILRQIPVESNANDITRNDKVVC